MYILRLDIKQTQKTLFAIERMSAMIGANALLGELLLYDFQEITKQANNSKISINPSKNFSDSVDGYIPQDNPPDFFKSGVVACTAGKFIAVFENKEAAIKAGKEMLRRASIRMPSLKIEADIAEVRYIDALNVKGLFSLFEKAERITGNTTDRYPLEFPYIPNCSHSASEPQLSMKGIKKGAGYNTAILFQQCEKVKRRESKDLFTGFTDQLLDEMMQNFGGLEFPYERIEDVIIGRKNNLAFISFDGNGIGSAFTIYCRSLPILASNANEKEIIRRAADEEWFWWRLRCAMRKAIRDGIVHSLSKINLNEIKYLPFRILWLGGDDAVVLSDTSVAFDFVQKVCEVFENQTEALISEIKKDSRDNKIDIDKLTLGSGIAIIPKNFPFSLARQLSDELLDSAKKLVSGNNPPYPGCSAVDWHIVKTSSVSELSEQRRREYMISEGDEICLLTKRPYLCGNKQPFLNELLEKARSLNKSAYDDIDSESTARNKRKKMRTYIRRSKLLAEWMYEELYPEKRDKLFNRLACYKNKEIFWTDFLDAAEIADILEV